MTKDDSKIFVDTNILVYANISAFPLHAAALNALHELDEAGHQLWISRQILREFIAVTTRQQTYSEPQPIDTVIARVEYFEQHFEIAETGPSVTAQLLKLIQQVSIGGKQVHDANIVATMLTAGVKTLLTHNTKDFQRFSDFINLIPLSDFQ